MCTVGKTFASCLGKQWSTNWRCCVLQFYSYFAFRVKTLHNSFYQFPKDKVNVIFFKPTCSLTWFSPLPGILYITFRYFAYQVSTQPSVGFKYDITSVTLFLVQNWASVLSSPPYNFFLNVQYSLRCLKSLIDNQFLFTSLSFRQVISLVLCSNSDLI